MVENALTFPGGGVYNLGRGQITDDSELAMCIMQGMADLETRADPANKTPILNLDGIGYYFGIWSLRAFGKFYSEISHYK
jgi:ADP-ribosylglycohydrolase